MFLLFDHAAFGLLNGQIRHPVLDTVLPWFSDAWLLWVGLAGLIICFSLYCKRTYGEALWRVMAFVIFLAMAAGTADLACSTIKDWTGRYRPFQSMHDSWYFTPEREWIQVQEPAPWPGTTGGSFPSAHAATSMAVAVVISLLFRKANPWIYLLPLMVGWSRIYVGKHFPLDVVAGWFVGLGSVLALWWLGHLVLLWLFARRRSNMLK